MGFLNFDEALNPKKVVLPLYAFASVMASIMGIISVMLITADQQTDLIGGYVIELDLFSSFFGILLPFSVGFLLMLVRDHSRYTTGTVTELCEFGFPFAFILGTLYVFVAYGQQFEINEPLLPPPVMDLHPSLANNNNDTYFPSWLLEESNRLVLNQSKYNPGLSSLDISYSDVGLYMLGPLLLVPAIMSLMFSVLDSRTVDPLLSISGVTSLSHVFTGDNPSYLAWVSMVLVSLAVLIRIVFESGPDRASFSEAYDNPPNTQLNETVLNSIQE